MNLADRKRGLKVAAAHAAKQCIELVQSVSSLAEKLEDRPARFEVDATWARGNIAAIRRELSDIESLLSARELVAAIEALPTAELEQLVGAA